MIRVLYGVWSLLLGIVLIMLGNGVNFTLIGARISHIVGVSPLRFRELRKASPLGTIGIFIRLVGYLIESIEEA